ncbi:MAG: XkdX family protein [Acidaminococcaceae bacterium]|nr:XkdX family protein [Acidaminococcaceae bacterium]
MMFEKIKKWYEEGLWTKAMVRNAVRKGKITAEQYEEIVGEPY